MSQQAVQMIWTMDTTGVDTAGRDRDFVERILPSIEAMPGYVAAVHSRSANGVRSYGTVVFDDSAAAEIFMGHVTRDPADSIAAGVHLHSIEMLDVIGR